MLDRNKIKVYPLGERDHALVMDEIKVCPKTKPLPCGEFEDSQIKFLSEKFREAKEKGKARMITYGAHSIKNGLGPVFCKLLCDGVITHAATNGAGSIHDWEFALIGKSTESVKRYVAEGRFGIWDETGKYLNLAIIIGSATGLGYGESVGKMIDEDGLTVPTENELKESIKNDLEKGITHNTAGKAELLKLIKEYNIEPGKIKIEHKCKDISVQYVSYKLGRPLTVHPGIGYDIIYTHPWNTCGSIGICAERDFLSFAGEAENLSEGGIHVTVGSAVMAPMVFEKSMSLVNNLRIQKGLGASKDFTIAVVDIADGGNWDWTKGEPPHDNPAYYLRFCKSFSRMGGDLHYVCIDNRQFLLKLIENLGI
ncbi:MAG: hypothetical protein KBT47_05840 [Armatimonadetes bacterium]|nr:hypothetical protein [Candidatus Hippobium faecium]